MIGTLDSFPVFTPLTRLMLPERLHVGSTPRQRERGKLVRAILLLAIELTAPRDVD